MFGTTGLDRLVRGQEGFRQRVRVVRLAEELEQHPIAIAHVARGWLPERITLWLDGGTKVAAKLYWRPRSTPAVLLAIQWRDDIGWVLRLRATDGDAMNLFAWQLAVDFPRTAA
jgi:hypothetical protein